MTFSMAANKVIESPKDEVLEAIIVSVEKTTWRNIISPEKLNKFDSPDEEIVEIKYQTKFKGNTLTNSETYKFYDFPMSNSKLGLFLTKYGDLEVEKKIKVYFDENGVPKITLPNKK
jgi:hypothetical protein